MTPRSRKILQIVLILAVATPLLLIGIGQLGWLHGPMPHDLGYRHGRFKPPSDTPNSVSSQTGMYPGHPQAAYADIAPLRFQGDGAAAMERLATVLQTMEGTRIVTRQPGYLHAECQTRWLRFTDDLEFSLDAPAGVIQVRSASRLGRRDWGANRARMEEIRARFNAP